MTRSSLSDLKVGQWQRFRDLLGAAGLDGDMVVDMIMRPHLIREMVQSFVWRKDPWNWLHEGLSGLKDEVRVAEMPLGSVGWISTEIFGMHHEGFGALAWTEAMAFPEQQHKLVRKEGEWASGYTAVIRSRSGGFWALNTHIAGTLVGKKIQEGGTDIYVQVVDIISLSGILGGLPGCLSPCVYISNPLQYKMVVQHEAGTSEAEMHRGWFLTKLVDGEWRLCRDDDPLDARAFEAARATDWLKMPVGEHTLLIK